MTKKKFDAEALARKPVGELSATKRPRISIGCNRRAS
jgi:hypothetical protein